MALETGHRVFGLEAIALTAPPHIWRFSHLMLKFTVRNDRIYDSLQEFISLNCSNGKFQIYRQVAFLPLYFS